MTVTFEGANVKASNNDYGEAQPYFKEDVEYGNIAAGGIKAPKLVLKNTVLKVDTGNVHYKEGLTPKAIGIDANELNVSGSEIEVKAGNCYESIGIRCTGIADFINSEVTAKSGTSDHISVGVDFNMMDVTDSTVYANGGEAKRYSAGLVGGMLNADGSQVKGYGGVATDTNIVDEEGVFSEGIFVETIYGTDSEIYGEGEKALVSTGIAATEISINGGAIYGIGSKESDDSIGIYLEPSQMDDGTPIPVKFELVGGDVVARGKTQGFVPNDEDFAGVSYKADENAEEQIKPGLTGKEFLFGNKYKVSYVDGDVDAENLPADGAYYREECYTLPKEVPTAEGYLFVAWMDADGMLYKAEDDNNFSMKNEDTVYTAVWKCVGGKDCILHGFDDLNAKAWYHDGIEYCIESKMMQGMSKTTFKPDTAVTRGMIVTTLYRMEGEPKVETQNEFIDVPADAWYTDAVNWAVEFGIAKGYENNSFRPDQPVTREELAVFLCRMAEYYGLDVTAPELTDRFADKDDVSEWAVSAMAWAVDQNIINGLTKDTIVPQGNASRAQLATMLYRFELSLVGEE